MIRGDRWITGGIVLLVVAAFVVGALLSPSPGLGDDGLPGISAPAPAPAGRPEAPPLEPIRTAPPPRPGPSQPSPTAARAAFERNPSDLALEGQVIDETGAAVAGAVVEVRDLVLAFRERPGAGPVITSATSGLTGDFRLSGFLRFGERYLLRVTHADHAPVLAWPVDALDPATLRQRVMMTRGMAVAGRVTDRARAPLAGARVTLYDLETTMFEPQGLVECETQVDAQGGFRFSHVAAGTKRIVVRHAGYGSAEKPQLPVREGQEVSALDFVLGRGTQLAGRVEDAATGQPIAGILVQVRPASLAQGPDQAPVSPGAARAQLAPQPAMGDAVTGETVCSGADGRFRFEGLEQRLYVLSVLASGRGPKVTMNVRGGTEDLVVRVRGSASLAGTVVDAVTGKPVVQFTAVIAPSPNPPVLGAARRVRLQDSEGAFVLSDVEPGTHYVIAEAPGFSRGSAGPFNVGEGERVTNIVVRLARGSVVSGRILGPEGGPVPGARLALIQERAGPASAVEATLGAALRLGVRVEARTLADGSYLFPGVAAGTYRLEVIQDEFAPAARPGIEVPAGGDCAVPDITLEAGAAIQGVVSDRQGQPDHLAVVLIAPVETGALPVQRATDGEGRFVVRGLKPGAYRIVVIQRRGLLDMQRVLELRNSAGDLTSLRAGEMKHVELREQ